MWQFYESVAEIPGPIYAHEDSGRFFVLITFMYMIYVLTKS